MTHLACMVTHDPLPLLTPYDSFLGLLLLVVTALISYINPHKPSSTFNTPHTQNPVHQVTVDLAVLSLRMSRVVSPLGHNTVLG